MPPEFPPPGDCCLQQYPISCSQNDARCTPPHASFLTPRHALCISTGKVIAKNPTSCLCASSGHESRYRVREECVQEWLDQDDVVAAWYGFARPLRKHLPWLVGSVSSCTQAYIPGSCINSGATPIPHPSTQPRTMHQKPKVG